MRHSSQLFSTVTRIVTFVLCCFWLQVSDAQNEPKRVFDEDFKERYNNEKFNYEGKEVVRYTRRGSGEFEEFENKKTEIDEENNEEEFTGDVPRFQFLNWIFVIALILAVIYLAYILINEGGTSLFSSKKNTEITTHEDFSVENIEQTDIESLITSAEKNGDYRLAIRFYHILVLKRLSLKNFIKLEEDKTNEEYFYEVKQQGFSNDFKFTSYLYDYIWYGEFPINLKQYQTAKENFVQLIKKVAS